MCYCHCFLSQLTLLCVIFVCCEYAKRLSKNATKKSAAASESLCNLLIQCKVKSCAIKSLCVTLPSHLPPDGNHSVLGRNMATSHARPGLRQQRGNITRTSRSLSLSGLPTAAPAGETCLNDAAAGNPSAVSSSETSCHELRASIRLVYPASARG